MTIICIPQTLVLGPNMLLYKAIGDAEIQAHATST